MQFETSAIYEDGVLKPDQPLPLDEHQRVTVVIQPAISPRQSPSIRAAYGIIGWQGDPDVVRKIALAPEFGIEESPGR